MRIKSFSGLRFIFSLLIVLNHMRFLMQDEVTNHLFFYFHNGGFSVTFFFLLSGFCIALGYEGKFEELSLKKTVDFTLKRVKHLYFVYIVTMLYVFLYYCLVAVRNNETASIISQFLKLLLAGTMTQSLTFTYARILNKVGWFASTIMCIYAVTPLMLHNLSRWNKRKLAWGGVSGYITTSLILILSWLYGNDVTADFLYVTPYFRILYFFIGVTAGIIFKRYFRNPAYSVSKETLLEICSILVCIAAYIAGIYIGTSEEIVNVIYIPALMFLIFVFAGDKGGVSAFMGNKINQYLGGLSMYLFLVHYLVTDFGGYTVLRHILGESRIILYVDIFLAIGISLLGSVVIRIMEIKLTDISEKRKMSRWKEK